MHFFIEIKGKCSSADLVLNLKYIGTREKEEVRGGEAINKSPAHELP